MWLVIVIVAFFSIFIMSCGVSFLAAGYNVVGIILIILPVIIIAALSAYDIFCRIRAKKIKEEYEAFLAENDFVCKCVTDDFLVDTVHKKWCKYFERHIFDFSEIENVEVKHNTSKHTVSTRTSSSTYNNYWKYSKTRKGTSNRISNTTSSTTYSVYISTKNVNCPVVTFYCGSSYEDAQKIVNTVNIIKSEVKEQAAV